LIWPSSICSSCIWMSAKMVSIPLDLWHIYNSGLHCVSKSFEGGKGGIVLRPYHQMDIVFLWSPSIDYHVWYAGIRRGFQQCVESAISTCAFEKGASWNTTKIWPSDYRERYFSSPTSLLLLAIYKISSGLYFNVSHYVENSYRTSNFFSLFSTMFFFPVLMKVTNVSILL
jgi:hypothetical protein